MARSKVKPSKKKPGKRPAGPRRVIGRVVVDESVSPAQWSRFQAFAAGKRISTAEPLDVGELHPGMPDSQILDLLLDQSTALLTNDRPFHNAALASG
jgi:hypothetical protein